MPTTTQPRPCTAAAPLPCTELPASAAWPTHPTHTGPPQRRPRTARPGVPCPRPFPRRPRPSPASLKSMHEMRPRGPESAPQAGTRDNAQASRAPAQNHACWPAGQTGGLLTDRLLRSSGRVAGHSCLGHGGPEGCRPPYSAVSSSSPEPRHPGKRQPVVRPSAGLMTHRCARDPAALCTVPSQPGGAGR